MKKNISNKKDFRCLPHGAKQLIRWQSIRLKSKGYTYSEIAEIVSVQARTLAVWWNNHSESNKQSKQEHFIKDKFGSPTLEMKGAIIQQIIRLKNKKTKYAEIADILGMNNSAQVSTWLRSSQKVTATVKHKKLKTKDNKNIKAKEKNTKKETLTSISEKKSSIRKCKKTTNTPESESSPKKEPSIKFIVGRNKLKNKNIKALNDEETLKIIENKKLEEIRKLKEKLSSLGELKEKVKDREVDKLIEKSKKLKTIDKLKEKIQHCNKLKEKTKLKEAKKKEQSLSIYQLRPDENIHIDSKVKVIKKADYAHYYDATTFLRASRNALNESKLKAMDIEKQAVEDAKLAISKAQNSAYNDGVRIAEEQIAEKNIEAALAAEKYLISLQEMLPDIILSIVRKFIENYDDTEFIIHNINSALKTINKKQKIKLHVNHEMVGNVESRLKRVPHSADKITLVADTSLEAKDCLIVTKLGVVNASLETQLKKIEVALSESLLGSAYNTCKK